MVACMGFQASNIIIHVIIYKVTLNQVTELDDCMLYMSLNLLYFPVDLYINCSWKIIIYILEIRYSQMSPRP